MLGGRGGERVSRWETPLNAGDLTVLFMFDTQILVNPRMVSTVKRTGPNPIVPPCRHITRVNYWLRNVHGNLFNHCLVRVTMHVCTLGDSHG